MTTTSNPRVEAIRQHVSSSYQELLQLVNGPLTALEPDRLYQPPATGEWTLMENLAHVIEIMPYWADEIAKLVAAPGQKFGRTMEHEGRLRAIQDHRADTLEQAKISLPGSYAHLDQVLRSLKDSDLALTGQHSKYGEQTLGWFIDEFVVRHLAAHVKQIKACL
jgi:uncharacterized damage-inducible protein DinB